MPKYISKEVAQQVKTLVQQMVDKRETRVTVSGVTAKKTQAGWILEVEFYKTTIHPTKEELKQIFELART